ncbi:N-acylethanolamine-hydrolyzing acid amidase [Merluccius polli]|uniref:N-acylethanolamine-hydrolyzing acid amidase n=1 Tax=Merluccius polli TaxID=89951 RepID=A0AA47NY44_MERPO|nr:N-acylethanolamine-hydrolyzing acid amidase [Merluccius polli]
MVIVQVGVEANPAHEQTQPPPKLQPIVDIFGMIMWSAVVLFSLIVSCTADFAPPSLNISLEDPPETRWAPIVEVFDVNFLKAAIAEMIDSTVPKWVHKAAGFAAAAMKTYIPEPYGGEIRGMAKHTGASVADIILLNFAYEITAHCTSIVAQDTEGNVYHGRNLDYFGEILRNLTVDVYFVKKGEVAYHGTTFAGYLGLWMGQSPKRFTISGNQRVVLFSLAVSCTADFAPPSLNISLEDPPETRWAPIVEVFDVNFLKAAIAEMIDSTVPKWVHKVAGFAAAAMKTYIPEPYGGEIRGMAKHTGASVADIILLNFAYEITAHCTSIVAQDTEGNVYHGRNLDYFGEVLRNLTVDVYFVKKGEVAYHGTTFAGYVGLWTGQSPKRFTISGNQRGEDQWWNWWKNVIPAIFSKRSPVSWLVREVSRSGVISPKHSGLQPRPKCFGLFWS